MANTLLLSLGAPYYRHDGTLYVELQTTSGLAGWLEGFDKVICFAICHDGPPPVTFVPVDAAPYDVSAVTHVPLPNGYDRRTYMRERKAVRETLTTHIQAADFRVFSFGGWIGDWGMEAASLCRALGKAHAVWLDRVESQVVLEHGASGGLSGLKARLRSAIIARNERIALRGAELGMLHGKTVFDKLGQYSRNPVQIEDIHVPESDRIPRDTMAQKLARADDAPLRIVYAGRLSPMKGPHDWVEVLEKLRAAGARVSAHWYGDGELADAVAADVAKRGLGDVCHLEGFVADREAVLQHLRDGDILMFCHLTDESPRILIETLHSGTPLVGYRDPFAGELAGEQGGGILVDRGDTDALAREVARLAEDRAALRDLQEKAAASAQHLTHEKVFEHRCNVVKTELGPK